MSFEHLLLPMPKLVTSGEGLFAFAPDAPICLAADSARSRRTAEILKADLAAAGVKLEIVAGEGAWSGNICLSIGRPPRGVPKDLADQGYRLEVAPDGVRITGWGEPGLYFGTRTLLQLLDGGRIPACRIEDWPDYQYRMVHYDLAREVTCNLAYLKTLVDRLSAFKINMMDLYFENRFRFRKHPLISPPGVMTAEQAKELDDYAKRRFVELVPQVNCLGHLENALVVKEYRHLAEDPDHPYCICPLHPETPRFIQDLIEEMSAPFSSKFFHMGGDEADQMGTCPKCSEWVKKRSKSELFAMHYGRVHEMIRKLGKRTMMWGDMLLAHPEAADLLPKDIVIFDWHYGESSAETVKFFTGRGFPVLACPAMSGFGRTAAPFKHAQNNIWTFIGQGKEGGAIGECTCAWELRLGHLFDNDYFGIILSSDRAWNLAGCRLDDFNRRFCKVFYGMDDLRPVQYFEAVSDGFADLQADSLGGNARSSWKAFGDLDKNLAEFGGKVSEDLYRRCIAHQEKCLKLLEEIRSAAVTNRETLAFADVPAHTSMLLVKKLYLCERADELAASGRPEEAAAALRELLAELNYFKSRFEAAVKAFGGSQADLERVAGIRKSVDEKLARLAR